MVVEQQQIVLRLIAMEKVVEVAAAVLVRTKQQLEEPHLLQDKALPAAAAAAIESLVLAAAVHQRLVKHMQVDMVVMAKRVQLLELALPSQAAAAAVVAMEFHNPMQMVEVVAEAEEEETLQDKLVLSVQIS